MHRPRFHPAALVGVSITLFLIAPAWAQQLGGARTVDVPIVQILAGLVLCTLAAFAFALFLRRRSGTSKPVFRTLLGRATLHAARDGISVLETRRLSPHADACRFTSGNREYLVVVTASSCTVISDHPTPPAATEDSTPESSS